MSKKLKFLLSFIFFIVILILFFFAIKPKFFNGYLINKKIDKCGMSQDQKCFSDLVINVFNKQGLDDSLDLIQLIYEKYPSFSSSCHDIGHLLGKETYKIFEEGKDFEINPKASFCSYGFYHGFMENLVSKQADVRQAREFCEYVDSQLSKETPDANLQCFHGIGHGWVNVHDDKSLWGDEEKIAKKGLKLCEEVSTDESEINRCATGVFNGISIFYTTGEYDIKVAENDPLWLCKKQENKYQDPCFISMNVMLTSLTNGDIRLASEYFESIIDDSIAQHAMLNLALPLGLANINTEDHGQNVLICRSLAKRLVEPCLQGYAFAFLEHGEPGKEYIKSIDFCKKDYLSDKESESCLSYIYSYLPQWYSKEKSLSICDNEGEYKDFCYQKINLEDKS